MEIAPEVSNSYSNVKHQTDWSIDCLGLTQFPTHKRQEALRNKNPSHGGNQNKSTYRNFEGLDLIIQHVDFGGHVLPLAGWRVRTVRVTHGGPSPSNAGTLRTTRLRHDRNPALPAEIELQWHAYIAVTQPWNRNGNAQGWVIFVFIMWWN